MKFVTKVSKIGNSLYMIIPKMMADNNGIKEGDVLEIDPVIISGSMTEMRCNDCNFLFENQRGIKHLCPNCNSSNTREENQKNGEIKE